jgi:hypothetical protein
MPPIACPRCQRVNPSEAQFCHHDGAELRVRADGQGRTAPDRLPGVFEFASGRRCRTYDELVEGCMEEWEQARELLRQGVFRRYLEGIGRLQLAHAAREAENLPDADIGLNLFLRKLPAKAAQAPKLDFQPRRLALGNLHVGDVRSETFAISNRGRGLLLGTLTVAEGGEWLSLAAFDSHADPLAPRSEDNQAVERKSEISLKVAREQQVTLVVDTGRLTAPQHYSAKLTLITNGGIVEIPVQLSTVANPFPEPLFAGVDTPRGLALRMQDDPKAAAPFLESGAVARWFADNGWGYPVTGPTAPGVAAVQQFFEAMGLAQPPLVRLAEPSVSFTCGFPEVFQAKAVVTTKSRRWVYVQATSEVNWLKVLTPLVSGPRQAVIEYEVDSSLLEPERTHETYLLLVANSGQRLIFRVRVHVEGPEQPFTRRLLRPFLTGAVAGMVMRWFLCGPAAV